MWRKLLVVTLVISIVPVPGLSPLLMAGSLSKAKAIQQQVERSRIGSYVALELTDGNKLEGRLESIEEKLFTVGLLQGEGTQLKVSFEQVAKLKVIKRTSYRAAGQPNPALAKQAVEGLGVGEHVMVKVLDETVFRGHIQAIDERSLSLKLDANAQLIAIHYDQVAQVQKNDHELPREVVILTFAFIAAIAVGVFFIVKKLRRSPQPQPTIPDVKSISPTTIRAGTSVVVRITGNNFVARATVEFEDGFGPAPTASNLIVSESTITATVTVTNGGPALDRVWDVVVTNPDGKSDRLEDGFTVMPEPVTPERESAAPSSEISSFFPG